MDFLDPQKQKRHKILLSIGYMLIAAAVVLATVILMYQAYGFGLDKNGRVIQNGRVFVSSHPAGAVIYTNGNRYSSATNTSLVIPAGQYTVQLQRSGYAIWQRAITVEGGIVERFDYPFLTPAHLVSTVTKQYEAAPTMTAPSLDHRWLFAATNTNTLDLYDLSATKPEAKPFVVPDEAIAAGSDTTGWQLVQWADDNRHVVVKRTYQKDGNPGSEYLLLDRQDAAATQNLSVAWGFNPATIALRAGKYDQYLALDQKSGVLFTMNQKKPTPTVFLEKVAAFATDGDTVVYATTQDAAATKAEIRIKQGDNAPYLLRTVSASALYLLDAASYNGTQYVVAGAQGENKAYVYKDPLAQLQASKSSVAIPVQILKVSAPTFAAFSGSSRFVVVENGGLFATYDVETDKAYAYQLSPPLDAPQTHAAWMDGFHLDFVSGGKAMIFDFDGANQQVLTAANPALPLIFDRNYNYLYAVTAQNAFTRTALLAPQDQ